MKKLICAMLAVAALVAATATIASAYAIAAKSTGTGAFASSVVVNAEAKKDSFTSLSPDSPADDIYLALLKGSDPATSWEDFQLKGNYTTVPESLTFAMWVDKPAVNTPATFNLWGYNKTSYVDDIVGQTWSVSVGGKEVGTFVWDDEHLGIDNPMFSYTFDDTTGMKGWENAALITLAPASTPEVPEPATMVAMLTGVAGLGSFVIRRKK